MHDVDDQKQLETNNILSDTYVNNMIESQNIGNKEEDLDNSSQINITFTDNSLDNYDIKFPGI